jgi:chromosome segregation protein
MYFKKLEIVGFKSFMDKTVLNFEPGITAIVGPNGCGKSNIFDSIRWVLGEQSAKALRGSQMEDVIFNGTDTKQSLGMAEVTLTFDNEKKHFSVDHDEVIINRRIFRSGESEYLLNKTQVRLKDIQDLLIGTGIGAESYSIVAQGKIELVLSSRPEDRRQIFDEASGITKYKSQKKEALRKLEETEQNLLRINDIISEVKRSIGYLERQANKARKYQSTFEELKRKELNLATLQRNNLAQQRFETSKQMEALKNQEEMLQFEIKEEEKRIAERNNELKNLEGNLAELKNVISSLENLIQRNIQNINFNRERIEELEKTRIFMETQLAQAKERLKSDEEKLNRQRQERLGLEKSLQDKSLALKDKQTQLEEIVSSIKLSLENIAQAKKDILELATKTSHVKNELTEINSKQQVNLARKKRLELEKAKVAEEKAQVEENLKTLRNDLEQLEKEYEQLNLRISSVKQELDTEIKRLSQLNQDVEGLERQKLSLVSQKEFLQNLKNRYDDIDESMNALIYLDKLPEEKITGLLVKIQDDPSGENRKKNSPRPQLNDENNTPLNLNFKLSGEAKPIDLDAQRVNEKINQLEEKIAVLKNNKVSLENHIQELNATLQNLTSKEQEQQIAWANKRTVANSVLEQFNKIKEEEDIVVLELSDLGNELDNLEAKLSSIKAHLSELEEENKTLDNSIHSEEEKINLNSKIKEEVLVVIAQVKTEIENLNRSLISEEITFKALEETRRKEEENILNQEAKIKETQETKEALEEEIEELEEKIIISRNDIESHNNSLFKEEKRCQELSGGSNAIVEKIDEKEQKLVVLKDKLYELLIAQKDIDFKYQSIKDKLFSTYKIDLDAQIKKSPIEAAEISILRQESKETDIRDSSEQNLVADSLSLESLGAADSIKGGIIQETNENKLCEEIQRLKEKIDSYGTVNLVAIQEYDELKKRYDFLTAQQNDLVEAKESLQEAIGKINRTTRKMFMETFQMVREEFRNYFRLLFNGGDAQIYLIDEHDPLESGIEIICRPPGKKLQNVLLLSGGEKSLSAIALIFAIFKVKPTPFCILDEIDAALDESNVERFGRLLQEFVNISQFIVITHNKRTIANADIIYGITMQESGVSKIVSVKFANDKPLTQKSKEPELVAV